MNAKAASIESPLLDAVAFFAPAALGLLAFAAAAALGFSPLAVLWIWIVLFDGPHMLAAYSRTYGDPLMWRERRPLLFGSLLAFAVGPALLLLAHVWQQPGIFTAFLALMSVYAYHHLVRQHWGFAAIYASRAGERPARADRWALYAGCWLPYVYFVVTHPSLRAMLGISGSPWFPHILLLGWLVVLGRQLLHAGLAVRGRSPSSWKQAYLLTAVAFHGFAYLVAARFEPLYSGAQGLDQEFMVLAAMGGIFHSAQYVALVALYHARSDRVQAATWFGAAQGLKRAALVTLPFVGCYFLLAGATGVYDSPPRTSLSNQLALAIWYGFALHHYWLDERIWRISRDPRLGAVLGLSKAPAPASASAAGLGNTL